MTVEVLVDTVTSWAREPDPNSTTDCGEEAGHVHHVEVFYTESKADPIRWRGKFFASGAAVGDTVYVVVADYLGGDTFGVYAGYYEIVDVLADQEAAEALAQAARSVGYSLKFVHNGQDYTAGWNGYFDQLQEIKVWACPVRPARS